MTYEKEFLINPMNDAAFKFIFAKHKEITLAFINAVFEFQGTEKIVDIDFY